MSRLKVFLIYFFAIILRWCISLFGYSGKNKPPMFGDYEAQRHWMEITIHLPLQEWYIQTPNNDLQYWGIDYPPLTSYISWFFGNIATFYNPFMIELYTSRGYETISSKIFMRLTVMFADLILYFPSVYFFLKSYNKKNNKNNINIHLLLLLLCQPAFLLIDHGHFQYNNIFLAFTLFGLTCILNNYDLLGCIFYCCALNFKQMSLYYAPGFTSYLLTKCIYIQTSNKLRIFYKFSFSKFVMISMTVIITFFILWFPFCIWTPNNISCIDSLQKVLCRIFPVSRGLFEDKVANFWCVIDFIFKVRKNFGKNYLLIVCTISTMIGFTPSIIEILQRKKTNHDFNRIRLLLALSNSSLSFFLFSYQVHEKSILIPLLPLTCLFGDDPLFVSWFSSIASFSMFFLLEKDGLLLPYISLQIILQICYVYPYSCNYYDNKMTQNSSIKTVSYPIGYCQQSYTPHRLFCFYIKIATIGMIILHLIQVTLTPPKRYPHIHMYLFSIYAFIQFLISLIYCTMWQWKLTAIHKNNNVHRNEKLKDI